MKALFHSFQRLASFAAVLILLLGSLHPASLVAEDSAATAKEPEAAKEVSEASAGWPHRWVTSLTSGSGKLYAGVADGLLLRESAVVSFASNDPTKSESLYTHPTSVWALASAPDGSRLASTDYKGNLVVYTLADKQPVSKDGVFERWTRALLFTPEGASLVAANEAGKVFLYDLGKGEVVKTAETDKQQIYSIALSPDGSKLACGDGAGSVHLLKFPELEPIKKVASGSEPVWAVCFTSDGKSVIAGGADRNLRSVVVDGDAEPTVIGTTSDWITSIVPDSKGEMAVGCMDGKMFITDGAKMEQIGKVPSGIWSIAFSDGKLLAATRKHMVATFVPSWKVGYTAPEPTK
ncbi:MAG: WD40 repeat domain-containing protein [Pirellulaceae bacterium]